MYQRTACMESDTICNIEWRDQQRRSPYMPICESTTSIPRDFYVDTRHNEILWKNLPKPKRYNHMAPHKKRKLEYDAINPETSLCFSCTPKQMSDTRIVWMASLGKGLKQFSSYIHETMYDKYFANESVRSMRIGQQ